MSATMRERLFGVVMFWTGLTTIFAWLPLVRIIGRPEGYTWSILGLSGAGTEGPYWLFIPLTLFVVTLLFVAFRGARAVLYAMLPLWHLTVTGVVLYGVATGGTGAVWQGQGLRFAIPMWMLIAPFVACTAIVFAWIVLDRRAGDRAAVPSWTPINTRRLVISLVLLLVALALFRAGSNYDWVTAAAIVTTVTHWILLMRSFEPVIRSE